MFIPLWVLIIVIPIVISILGDKEEHCENCCPNLKDEYGDQAVNWCRDVLQD